MSLETLFTWGPANVSTLITTTQTNRDIKELQDAIDLHTKEGITGLTKYFHNKNIQLEILFNHVDHDYAIRIYGGSFSIEEHKTPEGKTFKLMNLPYYLGTKIPEYVSYFLSK